MKFINLKFLNLKFINKSRLSFVICFIIAVAILFSHSISISFYKALQENLTQLIAPIEKASSSTLYSFKKFPNHIDSFFMNIEEHKQLKERNAQLEHYFFLYKQVELENKQLRDSLNFAQSLQKKYITAQVIARNNSSIRQNIIIDAGLEHGVTKGQIAIANNQLIGRVTEVNSRTATILLLIDKTSRIPANSLESKTKFIVTGLSTDDLSCKYLDEHVELIEGELIVTSGETLSITPGIIIGTIIKKDNNFYIKPTIDFHKIEFIHLIQP